MADKIQKIVLQYEVKNDSAAAGSLSRLQNQLNTTKTTAVSLQKELDNIRGDANAVALGQEYGKLAGKLEDSSIAARSLARELTKIGATKEQLAAAAQEFEKFRLAESGAGAGGTRGSALRLLGSQGRALPSIQTPLGIGTDQISNIIRMGGAIGDLTEKAGISTKALLAGGVAAASLGVALVLLAKNFNEVKNAALADLDARSRAITLLRQGSQEEIQARVNELAAKRKLNEEIAANANALVDSLRQNIIKEKGGGAALQAEINSVLGTGAGELAAAKENAEKANKALSETSTELNDLTSASGLTTQSAADLAAAERQLAQERANIIFLTSDVQNKLTADIEAYNLAQTGTSKGLADRNRQLLTELTLTQNAVDAATHKLQTEELSKDAQEALRATIDSLTLKANALQTSLEYVNKEFVITGIKAREAADELAQDNKDRVAIVTKYNKDVSKSNEDTLKAQADAAGKYNDALVKSADTAAKAAENALTKLNDQAEKLATSNQRGIEAAQRKREEDSLQAALKFQQTEAKAARDHADDLLDIQAKAKTREEDLIASRDFASLFRSRRDTSQQLRDAQRSIDKEKEERAIAFQQAADDRARDYAFQANERQIKYEDSLRDARVAYQKDLAAANAAHIQSNAIALRARDDQLTILNSKHVAELQMLRNQTQAELQLIANGYSIRLQQEQAFQNALIQADQLSAQYKGFAAGIGSAAGFGGVAAVNNNNRSAILNQTLNVTGNNPVQIATYVKNEIGKSFNAIYRKD